MILIIAYLVLGYWATGKVIYANKIVIYSGYTFFIRKNPNITSINTNIFAIIFYQILLTFPAIYARIIYAKKF